MVESSITGVSEPRTSHPIKNRHIIKVAWPDHHELTRIGALNMNTTTVLWLLIVNLPFPCLWLCGCRIHGPCGHRLLRSGQIQRHRWGLPLDRKPLWRPELICVLGRLPPNGEGQHYCKQPVPWWRPWCDQPHEFEAAAGFVNPPIHRAMISPRRNLVVDMRN